MPAEPASRASRACAGPLALLVLGIASCGVGPFRLPASQGVVVTLDGARPVPGAEVFQWYRGQRAASDAHPVYHSRFTTADAQGRFAFPSERVASPRLWLLPSDGPSWGVFQADHGFQRPRPLQEGGQIVLRLSPADAAARRASLAPFCDGTPEDRAGRRLAALACTHGDEPRPPRGPARD